MRFIVESVDPQGERAKAINSFYEFAKERLGFFENPPLFFYDDLQTTSFGLYEPDTHTVSVATEGRHISDILRTLGHELCHHRQITSGSAIGMSVEELEWESNAVAGMLMRDYNKLHPEMFGLLVSPGTPTNALGDGAPVTYPAMGSMGATLADSTRPTGPIEMAEIAPINSADSAAYAGLGIGPEGEPGVDGEAEEIEDQDYDHPHGHSPKHESTREKHEQEQWQDGRDRKTEIARLLGVAHLTELSSKTLSHYRNKAKDELKHTQDGTYRIDYFHNPNKRASRKRGIVRATHKLRSRYEPWNDLREDSINFVRMDRDLFYRTPEYRKSERPKSPFETTKISDYRRAGSHGAATRNSNFRAKSALRKIEISMKKPKTVKEDAPVNAAGRGGVAGIGVGPQGEPGFKKKRTTFFRRAVPVLAPKHVASAFAAGKPAPTKDTYIVGKKPLHEVLGKINGRWALKSIKTGKALAYAPGTKKPSDEWVAKQEKRVEYFKHLGEGLISLKQFLRGE